MGCGMDLAGRTGMRGAHVRAHQGADCRRALAARCGRDSRVTESTAQERISERFPAQTVDVLVPTKESLEMKQITPKEHISYHTLEQIVEMPVPQVAARVFEVIRDKDTHQERISERFST